MTPPIRTRLSTKVAVAASVLTLIFVMVAGAAAYTVMSLLIRGQVDTLLTSEAALRAEKVADLLDGIGATFRTVGGAHLVSIISGMDEINGVPVVVVAIDGGGRIIAASRPDHGVTVDPWVRSAAAEARPRARIVTTSGGPAVEAVLPVAGLGGGATGGGLVYRLALADLGRRVGPPAGARFGDLILHDGGKPRVVALGLTVPEGHPLVKEVPVRLPTMFQPVRATLRVGAEPSVLDTPLRRLATSMMVLGLVTTLVVVGISLVMGRRLTRALRHLTDAATGFTLGRGNRLSFKVAGDDEIVRLGEAFAGMVARLDSAYQDLERRSQTLLSNAERVAQVGSAVWELDSGRHVWSGQFHAILGLVPADIQPGLGVFQDRIHFEDRHRLGAVLDAAIAARQSDPAGRLIEDFRIVRADGEERVVQLRGQVAWNESGVPERMDLTLQDITERKLLERRLDNLVGELRRSNEELEQFAYVASHDLRQPLRVVGSYVTLIEEAIEDRLDGETREFMDFIRDGVRRMDLLITDLLAYSRVGRTSKDGPVDTGRALDFALIDLQVEIDDSRARINHPGRMPVVTGDMSETVRLFQNLVGNGIKYRAPDCIPEVKVGCVDKGAVWEFFVQDNGIGIPPEHRDRVFGIFQRLHARDEYEGTGIGLAICKKVVERQGGTIWVEEAPGQGTTFRFTWPKMIRSA